MRVVKQWKYNFNKARRNFVSCCKSRGFINCKKCLSVILCHQKIVSLSVFLENFLMKYWYQKFSKSDFFYVDMNFCDFYIWPFPRGLALQYHKKAVKLSKQISALVTLLSLPVRVNLVVTLWLKRVMFLRLSFKWFTPIFLARLVTLK